MDDILDTAGNSAPVAEVELSDNFVNLGDDINIMAKDPALQRIKIAVGWDSNEFDSDAFDLDLSMFLLDANDKTPDDSSFIYYNNPKACEGGVKHHGDNRIGVGEGDDEAISIDLHAVPFEISRVVIVLSIYKGLESEQGLGDVRKTYVRLVNEDSGLELLRFVLDDHFLDSADTAALIGSINREGPKWHFTPLAECEAGGLAPIAERYGMVIGSQ